MSWTSNLFGRTVELEYREDVTAPESATACKVCRRT
jgi:hypothetical protein